MARPPLERGQLLFLLAAGATVVLLLAAAGMASTGDPRSTAACLIVACAPYLVLWFAPIPTGLRAARLAGAAAALVGIAMVAVERNPLSDDVYRFVWDARVWLSGRSAYGFAPAAAALADLRDATVYPRINHPTIPTIYPPLAQGLFVLGYALTGAPLGMKLLGLVGHLATTALLPRCVPTLTGDTGARAAWLLALNPLALSCGALGGHFDLYLGLALLLATTALTQGRFWRAAGLLLVSVGLKLVGVFALPLFVRRPAVAAMTALVAVALAAPLAWAGSAGGSTPGLAHFGQRWQGNAGPFVLLTVALDPVVDALASTPTRADALGDDEVLFRGLKPWLQRLETLGVRPKSALRARLKPERGVAVYPRHHAVGLLARALVAALALFVAGLGAIGIARGRISVATGMRATLWCLLLLSPQVHPWYLLWLLPLEVACGGRAMLVWGVVILGAYAPLPGWQLARQWHESPWFVTGEYALVVLALVLDIRRAQAPPKTPVPASHTNR